MSHLLSEKRIMFPNTCPTHCYTCVWTREYLSQLISVFVTLTWWTHYCAVGQSGWEPWQSKSESRRVRKNKMEINLKLKRNWIKKKNTCNSLVSSRLRISACSSFSLHTLPEDRMKYNNNKKRFKSPQIKFCHDWRFILYL